MNTLRIEHIALWVRDLEALSSFYSRFFGASIGPFYENPKNGFKSRFLLLGSGTRIELMETSARKLMEHEPGTQRIGLAHFAIAVGSETEVDGMTLRLRDAGVTILSGHRRTGDGHYESVILDPDGNRIELTA